MTSGRGLGGCGCGGRMPTNRDMTPCTCGCTQTANEAYACPGKVTAETTRSMYNAQSPVPPCSDTPKLCGCGLMKGSTGSASSESPKPCGCGTVRGSVGCTCGEKVKPCGCGNGRNGSGCAGGGEAPVLTEAGRKLMAKIRAVDFALYETVLYLDVYPHSCEALATYHKLKAQREELYRAFESTVGPLTAFGNESTTSWDWMRKPFPWEYDAE